MIQVQRNENLLKMLKNTVEIMTFLGKTTISYPTVLVFMQKWYPVSQKKYRKLIKQNLKLITSIDNI